MSDNTKIEWASRTWNPLLGCERISPGCDRCYAITQARIRAGNPNPQIAEAFGSLTRRTETGLDWTGRVNLLPDRLLQPLTWKKPEKVFVNSLSDLFHKDVPDDFIARVFAVMSVARQHTFQVLTKRHGRMRALLNNSEWVEQVGWHATGLDPYWTADEAGWPFPNVWLGVSAEDQHWADIRIPALLATPAAVRFISAEPLLGPVDLTPWIGDSLGVPAESRGRGLSSCGDGRTDHRPAGIHLAGSGTPGRPLGDRHTDDPVHAETSGAPSGEVLAGAGDVRGASCVCASSPGGVETLQWPDSRRSHGEPQERATHGELAGESGASHHAGAGDSRSACAEARSSGPMGFSQRDGQAHDGRGPSHLLAARGRREASGDSRRLWRGDADDLEDRAGRPSISWVIVGGESGPGARPMDLEWARSIVGLCTAEDVPAFVKQLGAVLGRELGAGPKGGDWDAFPEDLKIREFPRAGEQVPA